MRDTIYRDEAIEAVCGVVIDVFDVSPTKGYEVSEKALSALPSADTEQVTSKLESAEAVTNGRLIDADALSEKLCETTIFIKDGEVFQRMINDAPTVSAEAVQGEWIRVGHDIYECSLCHQNVMTRDIDCYAYCHGCGAKMKGGDDKCRQKTGK